MHCVRGVVRGFERARLGTVCAPARHRPVPRPELAPWGRGGGRGVGRERRQVERPRLLDRGLLRHLVTGVRRRKEGALRPLTPVARCLNNPLSIYEVALSDRQVERPRLLLPQPCQDAGIVIE